MVSTAIPLLTTKVLLLVMILDDYRWFMMIYDMAVTSIVASWSSSHLPTIIKAITTDGSGRKSCADSCWTCCDGNHRNITTVWRRDDPLGRILQGLRRRRLRGLRLRPLRPCIVRPWIAAVRRFGARVRWWPHWAWWNATPLNHFTCLGRLLLWIVHSTVKGHDIQKKDSASRPPPCNPPWNPQVLGILCHVGIDLGKPVHQCLMGLYKVPLSESTRSTTSPTDQVLRSPVISKGGISNRGFPCSHGLNFSRSAFICSWHSDQPAEEFRWITKWLMIIHDHRPAN